MAHGINCFVNRQLIYNFLEELFADAGVLAIEHADFDGIERLTLVIGGKIVSTFDNLLKTDDIYLFLLRNVSIEDNVDFSWV